MSFGLNRLVTVSATGCVAYALGARFCDSVQGDDAFARHTREQMNEHMFSGMHKPFIASTSQQEFFQTYFPHYSHLLPRSSEELSEMRSIKTPVEMCTLSDCPLMPIEDVETIVVGGPPAVVSAANLHNVLYINDPRQAPIAHGSAFHLEWDSPSEAPTSYRPSSFFARQVKRLIFHESIAEAASTGHFSWRSLDWIGWISHPKNWIEGLRIALAFEKATRKMSAEITDEVAARSKANQAFYEKLNQDLSGKLFLAGQGSLIVARTAAEEQDLYQMQNALEKEGRCLRILTSEEVQSRYGFLPEGILFAEKTHDRVLNPNFMQILAKRIESRGGVAAKGVVTHLYSDSKSKEGVIRYTMPSGEERYVRFSKLILSLGNQRFIDNSQRPLFDIVAARGVSALGIAYLPEGASLPPVIVCGGTNHVTVLADPLSIKGEDGKVYTAYLVRMTAAACITPNVHEENAAHYDGTAANGLIAAVRNTLGCKVEVFTVYGCNRQVSQYGQTHWLAPLMKENPFSSDAFFAPHGRDLDAGSSLPSSPIAIQMGAGGGGLTQAPSQAGINDLADALHAVNISDKT